MKILILEDNPAELEQYSSFMKGHGYSVVETNNSKETINAFQDHEDIDLFFCDINLDRDPCDRKNGINGLDVVKNSMGFSLVPVLFFTNHHDDSEYRARAQEILGTRPYDFVPKPIIDRNPEQLLALLDTLIERSVSTSNLFYDDRIGIRTVQGGPVKFFSKRDIIFIETKENFARANFLDGSSILISCSLTTVYKQLGRYSDCFLRLGASIVINIDHLISYQSRTITLTTGIEKGISRAGWQALKSRVLIIRTDPTTRRNR